MIGIIGDARRDRKSSFADLLTYCEKDGRAEYTGTQNIQFNEAAAEEMESLAFKNPRCKNPLMHIILSWREMELPTNDQVDEAVKIALKELDLQDCQAVWIVHSDTENRHVHIAVNRIDPETYKAIQPAGRWTHRAIQRAARKIELAQSWTIEQNGSYRVTEDGELVEKSAANDTAAPKLSKNALDLEAHTAAKSAERICQETAAPIIREVRSWEELHKKLAGQGMTFEKKGSGAVLMVGDTAVKASKAGRDISMSKLEARLGEYRPRPADVSPEKRPVEPIERIGERKVKSEWDRYTTEREWYFREKKESAAELNSRQKIERSELQTIQKLEREKLFSRSWKGMGDTLNRRRSLLAASQQAEKLNLRDRHKHERDLMKKRYPTRFINFKRWLETREENQEAFISFRYPDNGVISGTDEGISSLPSDLRAFTPLIWNKGGVAYFRTDSCEAEFIDYGKKIVLAEKCGDEAILAALQLANQKWGGAVITGTEEYKQKCVELAARHNLKISNPELAREVEAARKDMTQIPQKQEAGEIEQEKSDQLSQLNEKSIFIRYADAVGAERFRVVVTEFKESGTQAFLFDKKNGGYEGKTREEILDAIPKFAAYGVVNIFSDRKLSNQFFILVIPIFKPLYRTKVA
jgi:hypothetical protein